MEQLEIYTVGLLSWEPTVMRNVTLLLLECNPPTWYVSLYRVQRIFSLPRGPMQHDITSTSIKTKKKHRALVSDIWMENITPPDLSGIWRMLYIIWNKITMLYLASSIRCIKLSGKNITRWRHQMETFSALLAICAGNSPVPGEFPALRPVTQSFDIFFDMRPNKRLSKQWWAWWFETQPYPLWRHRNEMYCDWMQLSLLHNDKSIRMVRSDILS